VTLCEPIVSVRDKEWVIDPIRHARSPWSTYAPCLDWFQIELSRTPALPPGEVPGDVITMNSRFELLDLRSGETAPYTLVYPEEESLERAKLYVLSRWGWRSEAHAWATSSAGTGPASGVRRRCCGCCTSRRPPGTTTFN
jgi:regulator of nucleoside diphosphate kinase